MPLMAPHNGFTRMLLSREIASYRRFYRYSEPIICRHTLSVGSEKDAAGIKLIADFSEPLPLLISPRQGVPG